MTDLPNYSISSFAGASHMLDVEGTALTCLACVLDEQRGKFEKTNRLP